MSARPRIIILGAGFGGLQAAQQFAGQSVDVLLVDRNNFHTFTPLLYQVATCALDPGDIAYPIRTIFRRATNIHFLMGEVQAINPSQKTVLIKVNGQQRTEVYDFLIVAVGTITNYFNIQALRKHAFGLKDLRDAVRLRNHILRQFEKAAWTQSPTEREARTTFVVVGGGPTGIETAGALFELYNHVLRKEYSAHPHMKARVILLEATNTLLAPYPDRLRQSALAQLQSLGVEVWLNARVADASHNQVTLADGRVIQSYTLVWAAGVRTTPLIETINVVLAAGGRIPVNEYLQVPEYPDIYAVGDIAYLLDENNQPYPQLIPVANQQGALAAKNILQRL
ncbi:MAG: NAD(P)/FAD-dependent oxidoreductase, partial [Chloroflexi bacterium]